MENEDLEREAEAVALKERSPSGALPFQPGASAPGEGQEALRSGRRFGGFHAAVSNCTCVFLEQTYSLNDQEVLL